MIVRATIGDVAPPGWLELGHEFRYCAQINVMAADAIVWSPVFTYEADVSGLTFLDPANLDRRVLYYDGASFNEIDSDVRDIGMGLRVYFPAQINLAAAASDTTSYWLFWNSTTAFATKTNRDNIYLAYSDCDDIGEWNTLGGTWWIAGNRLHGLRVGVPPGPYGALRNIILESDVIVYGLVNYTAPNANAGIVIRADTDNTYWWVSLTDQGGGRFQRRFVLGAYVWVPAVTAPNTDYVIKVKVVGNNYEAWWAEAGTPIAGAALLAWNNATGNDHLYAGFGIYGNKDIEHDNLYVLHAVTNDPTVTLGATQTVADIMPKNITGELQEPAIKIATITEIEGPKAVIYE